MKTGRRALFIDLDMDKIEKIRAEIERRYAYQKEMYSKTKPDGRPNDGWAESLAIMRELEELRVFIDFLQKEPAPMSYDEAYLNEKIAKASKTWKGVDVDKYMDEVRGREPDKSLEEEVKRYYSDNFAYISSDQPTLSILTNVARHFAEWQKERLEKNILTLIESRIGEILGDAQPNPILRAELRELIEKIKED